MKTKVEEEKDVGAVDLSHYMQWVIGVLSREHKYPAVHTYRSTLRSFRAFPEAGQRHFLCPRCLRRGV